MATGSSSLVNLSVPASDSTKNTTMLQPKLQFRFRAVFQNFGKNNPTDMSRLVRDITRPSVSFQEIPIDIYNSKIYVAGKHEWQDTTITLIDDANGSVSSLVAQQLQKQLDFAEQSGAAAGSDYKFMIKYEVLDGGNGANAVNVLETWELYGCFVKSVNYNNMSYSSNEMATIQLVVRFDNALQLGNGLASVGPATGVGQS